MGKLKLPKYKPYKKPKPVWFHTMASGHRVYVPEDRAQEFMQTGKPLFKKMKKYELEEL